MTARFPVLAQALYENEQIEARVALNKRAIDYVSLRIGANENYKTARARIIEDPKTPADIREILLEVSL